MGGVPSVEQSFLMSTISWRGENGYNAVIVVTAFPKEEVHILRRRY